MHGLFGDHIGQKRAREKKHTNENKDLTVYFSGNEISGVHYTLSIFVGVCTHT